MKLQHITSLFVNLLHFLGDHIHTDHYSTKIIVIHPEPIQHDVITILTTSLATSANKTWLLFYDSDWKKNMDQIDRKTIIIFIAQDQTLIDQLDYMTGYLYEYAVLLVLVHDANSTDLQQCIRQFIFANKLLTLDQVLFVNHHPNDRVELFSLHSRIIPYERSRFSTVFSTFFSQNYANMMGSPLNAIALFHPPHSYWYDEEPGTSIVGSKIDLIVLLADRMNASIRIDTMMGSRTIEIIRHYPKLANTYRYNVVVSRSVVNDLNFSGQPSIIMDFVDHKSDGLWGFQLYPHYFEAYTLIVPNVRESIQQLGWNSRLWNFWLAGVLVIGLLRKCARPQMTLWAAVFHMFAHSFAQNSEPHARRHQRSEHYLIVSVATFGLMMSILFSGIIFEQNASALRNRHIESIEELYSANICVICSSYVPRPLLQELENSLGFVALN